MLRYGTRISAGVTPGKTGETVLNVPVFSTVESAVRNHPEINSSILFVPAAHAPEAVYEALDSGISFLILITERIPVHDTMRMMEYASRRNSRILGPNCPGVISPSECKAGILPGNLFSKGKVGIVSRSGSLTYEVARLMTKAGLGQSTAVGVGGDPVIGLSILETVRMFQNDPETKVVVVIGEIGGDAEEKLAEAVQREITLPMVGYIAGSTAPQGVRMGHAGAIISGTEGTASEKKRRLAEAGVLIAEIPSQIPQLVMAKLNTTK